MESCLSDDLQAVENDLRDAADRAMLDLTNHSWLIHRLDEVLTELAAIRGDLPAYRAALRG